jgi:hypothetical protein
MSQDIWCESDRSLCESSRLHLICDGAPVSVWTRLALTQTLVESASQTFVASALELAPCELVVIGRQEGGRLSYLDPCFTPTQIVPDSGRTVLKNSENDIYVSRGHFTLRASVGGILLLNGVPGIDGRVRPPMNRTFLVEPLYRELDKGELVLVRHGSSATILLPNSAMVTISAS